MMRLLASILMIPFLLAAPVAGASEGLQTRTSDFDAPQTMDRLERAVRAGGFRVFARIDHGRAAERVDIPLRPTLLLIFGRPEAGSLLMQKDARIGIDLPMKYLVWVDEASRVQIGWNDPIWTAKRHAIDTKLPVLDKMSGRLQAFAEEAGQR